MRNPYEQDDTIRPAVSTSASAALRRARDGLAQVAATGLAMPQIPVLVGRQGHGASAAMQALAHDAVRDGFVCVDLTLDDTSRASHLLERAVRERFRRITWWARRWHARDTTHESEARIGLSLNAIGVATKARPDAEVSRGALADLLRKAARTAVRKGHAGLVVAIDDVHAGSSEDFAVLTHALRDAVGASPDGKPVPLAVVAAGLPAAVDRITAAGGLDETVTYVAMVRLDDEAARRAVLEPAERLGVTWDPRALEEIVAGAQGSPQLLRTYAHEAWAQAAPIGASPHVGLPHALAGIDLVQERLHASTFGATWRRATDEQRAYLRVMAQTTNPIGEARTDHVAMLLGRPAQELAPVRESLVEQGVIDGAGSGRVSFAVPGFEAYVLETADLGRFAQADLDAHLAAGAGAADLPPLQPIKPHRARHAAVREPAVPAGVRPPQPPLGARPCLPITTAAAPTRHAGRHRRTSGDIQR
ncbi:hypothetical protein PZ938_13155 [Luteipulveratus sp. YIM 133132]|uniref:hypothetical protein n=1 Tax=Luteipulveratus flavus TaxID=3031728 RepID=UPI0023B0CD45|nr:hypothetical protein [Luteipulveratus sp. YIM 133132]MDE9366554.1 hypothetical protein [Luteipulveratus sp. YIM 133132]